MEKDLNFTVARYLQSLLEQGGAHVVLTRSDDKGIYDVSGNIRNKKNSDMKNRERLIKESGADAFISIHMNKFSDEQYSGPQVFYSANDERSKMLAEKLQSSLTACLKPQKEREIKKADGGIYLLKKAEIPAVLVECGFLSNRQEERKLMDENYQKEIAWAIYCGIIHYFDET